MVHKLTRGGTWPKTSLPGKGGISTKLFPAQENCYCKQRGAKHLSSVSQIEIFFSWTQQVLHVLVCRRLAKRMSIYLSGCRSWVQSICCILLPLLSVGWTEPEGWPDFTALFWPWGWCWGSALNLPWNQKLKRCGFLCFPWGRRTIGVKNIIGFHPKLRNYMGVFYQCCLIFCSSQEKGKAFRVLKIPSLGWALLVFLLFWLMPASC